MRQSTPTGRPPRETPVAFVTDATDDCASRRLCQSRRAAAPERRRATSARRHRVSRAGGDKGLGADQLPALPVMRAKQDVTRGSAPLLATSRDHGNGPDTRPHRPRPASRARSHLAGVTNDIAPGVVRIARLLLGREGEGGGRRRTRRAALRAHTRVPDRASAFVISPAPVLLLLFGDISITPVAAAGRVPHRNCIRAGRRSGAPPRALAQRHDANRPSGRAPTSARDDLGADRGVKRSARPGAPARRRGSRMWPPPRPAASRQVWSRRIIRCGRLDCAVTAFAR
jgi:hypothetical protein